MTSTPAKKAAPAGAGKSGIKTFKPGEIIFNENDVAKSLYIIQSGQIRLFRPKGRGFVDIAILRAGEVIGEMAYFDEKASRRSCSAQSIVTTQVVEISFPAFEKTMQGLNPWFKTIINTLADRLRKTNEKVKSLESNSVGFGKDGKVADYKFFHNIDIIRILSLLYLTMKTHGEKVDDKWKIHINKIKFYLVDVFNIQEVKWEEFLQLLKTEHFVEMENDEDGFPKIIVVPNVESFRSIMAFIDGQRRLDDSKQMKISSKCERFLKRILDQLLLKKVDKPKAPADITAILADFKERKVPISDEDLRDAVEAGLCDDIVVGEGNKLTSVVEFEKLKKIFPAIKMMNAVQRVNDEKNKTNKYS